MTRYKGPQRRESDPRAWAKELVAPVLSGQRRVRTKQVCIDCGGEARANEYVGGPASPRCAPCARWAARVRHAKHEVTQRKKGERHS